MGSITTKYIFNRLEEIKITLSNNWNTIITNNITPKNLPVKFKTNKDLKELIKQNVELMEERILLKLYKECINIGYTKFSELPITNNFINIYTLSERSEYLFKLDHIPTLNKKIKRAKGKKNLEENEILTSDYINSLKKPIELEIIALKEKLTKFNDEATLEIESPAKSLAV